ncbi:MAG: STAS domain-containing protein [Phycisphaerae bacterium]|nr:STAS domain-containing protein [Phycisphaerae bacterium]MDW8262241.1 STAS domain-containing protein [Phycisphaerales bacterium]
MPRELFQVVHQSGSHVLQLTVPASADVSEFDKLNQAALSEIESAADQGWILDMSGCSYVGSAALGFMINVRQRIKKANGALVLCGVSKHIASTLRASSLGRLFYITEDRASAEAVIADWLSQRRGGSKPQ